MSSAGHVLDMINKIRSNRSFRNKSSFKGTTKELYTYEYELGMKPSFKQVSAEELKILKKKIRLNSRQQRKKEYLLFGLLLVVLITMIYIVFWLIFG